MSEQKDWPTDPVTGVVTVKLCFPIMGGNVKEVKLRRPKAGDIRKIKAIENDTERGFVLAQELSGMSAEHFDELDVIDMNEISGVVTRMHSKSSAQLG
jgi:hypothetical protein